MTATTTVTFPSTNAVASPRYVWTVPAFLLGSMIALASQFILQFIFYGINTRFVQELLYTSSNETNLSLLKVLCFSIIWSFGTCVMVFLGMVSAMQIFETLCTAVPVSESATTKDTTVVSKPDDEEDEDTVNEEVTLFAMEISYVFGAIVAILLLWGVFDFGLSIYPPTLSSSSHVMHTDHSYLAVVIRQSPLFTVLLTMMITFLALSSATAVIHMVRHAYHHCQTIHHGHQEAVHEDVEDVIKDEDRSVMRMTLSIAPSPTEWFIYCVASTVGLMIGMGTQVLLSFLLWNNVSRIPYVIQSNFTIALFSFGWSTITVMVTALACYVLRVFVFHCIVKNYMHRNLSVHYQSLLVVRMEAMYIGWTLTGICVGWIILDVVHKMTSQIYISILLFILSLSSFGFILYYFPEETVDIEASEDENDDANATLTEPLLLTEDIVNEMA